MVWEEFENDQQKNRRSRSDQDHFLKPWNILDQIGSEYLRNDMPKIQKQLFDFFLNFQLPFFRKEGHHPFPNTL